MILHHHWLLDKPGWNALGAQLADDLPRHRHHHARDVTLDDRASVVASILRAAAPRAVVFPSERYFYWEFPLGHRLVRGNLRFTDIEAGILHFGYFDDLDPSRIWSGSLTEADGLRITMVRDRVYRVELDGISVEFELARGADRRPTNLRLAPGEEIVSGIVDESGFLFWLIWNGGAESFSYVVDDSLGVWDALIPVEGTEGLVEVGRESRFVFLVDREWDRRVLIGVWAKQIQWNTYFDGPFDQVPPRLPIKDRLERAYPYVKARGGIDDHGNFVALDAQRVAISPYAAYESLDALAAHARALHDRGLRGPELWVALTHEWKRDFLRDAPPPRTIGDLLRRAHTPHALPISQGWPANHDGDVSRSWPGDHGANRSTTWPASHDPASSAQPR